MSYPVGTKVMIKPWAKPGYYDDRYVGEEIEYLKERTLTVERADYDPDFNRVTYLLCEDRDHVRWPEEVIVSVQEEKKPEEKRVLLGVSPDEPVVENEHGGRQSDTPYGFHLLPIDSLFAAARVAKYGADKYGETFSNRNYTKIPVEEHINHAIQHLYAHLAGDTQDEHLAHAIARVLFAYDVAAKAGQV